MNNISQTITNKKIRAVNIVCNCHSVDKSKQCLKYSNMKITFEVNCSVPEAPPNGHILGLDYDTDGVVQLKQEDIYFVCAEGFHLIGSETRKCLPNGTWSGRDVICVGW